MVNPLLKVVNFCILMNGKQLVVDRWLKLPTTKTGKWKKLNKIDNTGKRKNGRNVDHVSE